MRYLVQHDFAKYQPAWKGDYPRRFGEHNEGFTVDAVDLADAKEQLIKGFNLNPFYLRITKIDD